MGEKCFYVIYDYKRDRDVMEFDAFSDEVAKREFSGFYNERIGTARWEARKFGRYFLFKHAKYVDGVRKWLGEPVMVMVDDEVRLSRQRWFMADPPSTPEEWEEDQREYDRLNGLDAARLARRGNQAA